MLVPAMAFVWCVLSAEASGTQNAVHAGTLHAMVIAGRAKAAPIDGPSLALRTTGAAGPGEQRTPIRTAIPVEVIAFAKTLVNLPMGAERVAEILGQRYIFVLERHYHPPGFVGAPSGWHKGVTAYELR
ncbi:MAG TPA: hypothetical protein VH044_11315 [Polyangiaceae bacterium]|nr:hypothetical protein [Polyangiaceae bacterium]